MVKQNNLLSLIVKSVRTKGVIEEIQAMSKIFDVIRESKPNCILNLKSLGVCILITFHYVLNCFLSLLNWNSRWNIFKWYRIHLIFYIALVISTHLARNSLGLWNVCVSMIVCSPVSSHLARVWKDLMTMNVHADNSPFSYTFYLWCSSKLWRDFLLWFFIQIAPHSHQIRASYFQWAKPDLWVRNLRFFLFR